MKKFYKMNVFFLFTPQNDREMPFLHGARLAELFVLMFSEKYNVLQLNKF